LSHSLGRHVPGLVGRARHHDVAKLVPLLGAPEAIKQQLQGTDCAERSELIANIQDRLGIAGADIIRADAQGRTRAAVDEDPQLGMEEAHAGACLRVCSTCDTCARRAFTQDSSICGASVHLCTRCLIKVLTSVNIVPFGASSMTARVARAAHLLEAHPVSFTPLCCR
jgi:hypothetical protein